MLSPNEVANINDYMSLPIILVVTNDPQPSVENVDADCTTNGEHLASKNSAQNDAHMD
jgi:hypothetical protein